MTREKPQEKSVGNPSELLYENGAALLKVLSAGATVDFDDPGIKSTAASIPQDKFQSALCKGIARSFYTRWDIPKRYVELLDKKTLEELRGDDKLQSSLLGNIFARAHEGRDIPESYIALATDNTLRSALWETVVKLVDNGLKIPDRYVELLQSEVLRDDEKFQLIVAKGVKKHITKDWGIPQQYFELLDKQTLRALQGDDKFQSILCQEIKKFVNAWQDVPEQYIGLLGKKTLKGLHHSDEFQDELHCAIKGRIGFEMIIPKQYLTLVSDKVIQNDTAVQTTVRESVKKHIGKGWHIPEQYIELISSSFISKDLQDSDFVREICVSGVNDFFGNSPITAPHVSEVIDTLNYKEMHRMLFDKTLLPVGIKIHAAENSALARAMSLTGGFVAHNQDSCYVTNPVPNTSYLKVCLEVLRKAGIPITSEHSSGVEEVSRAYIQVTSPDRIPNEYCGLATFAYLFSHSQIFDFNTHTLSTNQIEGEFLTIRDAGVLKDVFFIPTQDGTEVKFAGRTDLLLAFSMSDIENANLIMSLLVASQKHRKNMLLHKLGVEFAKDVYTLLKRFKLAALLDAKFVNDEDLSKRNYKYDMRQVLQKIQTMREQDAQLIIRHNKEFYESAKSFNIFDINAYLDSQKLRRQNMLEQTMKNTLTYQMNELLRYYRHKVYENGYISELGRTR